MDGDWYAVVLTEALCSPFEVRAPFPDNECYDDSEAEGNEKPRHQLSLVGTC